MRLSTTRVELGVSALPRPKHLHDWLHKRLYFLKGNLRFVLCWPLAALLGITLAWSTFFHNLEREKIQIGNDALADVSIIARNHASHAKRTIDSIDQILLLIKLQWEASGGTLQLESLKSRGMFPDAMPFNVSIIGRDGIRRTTTFEPRKSAPYLNVYDGSYFLVHKKAAADFLVIGKPIIGRITGKEIIQYSRRLVDQNNQFDGVVLVSVETAYLNDDYDSITLGRNGILGTVGTDGQLRAARIGNAMQLAEPSFLTSALPLPSNEDSALATSTLVDGATSFLDRRNRYISWHPVAGYPVVAFAGIDEEEVLAPYWQRRHDSIVNALWTTLSILLFTLLSVGYSVRLVWRRHQLELARVAHRVASESGSEGFYLMQPIKDDAGAIIDFQITECNERGASFFQRHCNEMIGERLSVLYSATQLPAWRSMLLAAMKTGEQVAELTLSKGTKGTKGTMGRQRIVHVKARAAQGNIAVTLRDITHEKELIHSLERRTQEDMLTGLPNRAWAATFLPGAIGHAAARHSQLAVLFIDLDGFKTVNDTLGHAAGDEVLRMTAKRLLEAAGPHTHIARFGGDEFLVILENVEDKAAAAQLAQRLIDMFQTPFLIDGNEALIGTSIGIGLYPEDAGDAETLIRHADTAMYAVKMGNKHGHNHRTA